MGTVWVKEFTGGLDTRRMPETTTGGVLIVARNGHITRGGEFEKRAAFIKAYTLPAGTTRGLAYNRTNLVVFGHNTAPSGMPAAVGYQRIQPPTGTALARILSFDLYAGNIYVVGEFADGTRQHFYNGARVTSWFDGRARASFRVLDGDASSALNLTVNGVAIVAAPVSWATSNVDTAAAIAAAINAYTSSPDYTATSVDDTVNIVAAVTGTGENGKAVGFVRTGNFQVDPATGLTLKNGATTTGTFLPGTFVRTIGSKEYSVSGSILHFSGIQAPTKWTTDTNGAGFIDMSTQASGSEQLTAVATYQDFIAVFAEKTTQIWYVDPDPTLNKKAQVLKNTGTASPRSVTEFGDNDLFYLDESGVRSLRARDASNAAATTDIGVPVDDIIIEKLRTLTFDERDKVIGLIEPSSGRFWLIIKDTIFVFSFFSGAKVSAWSTYELGFEVSDAVVFQRRVYLRSGDDIYVYGGLGSAPVYDETVAEAWLPYLDANTPTRKKGWTGIDAAVEGLWEVHAALNPADIVSDDLIARIVETTFNDQRIPMSVASSHLSLRFRSVGSGPAKIGSAIVHYEGKADED